MGSDLRSRGVDGGVSPSPGASNGADAPWRADLALVRQACAGSDAARERLAQRLACVPRILAALDRRLSCRLRPEELADLSQEVLVRVWGKLDAFAGRAALESWVHRFCFLELQSWLRRSRRLPRWELTEERPAPASDPEPSPADFELLLRTLAQLRPPADAIVRLKHFEELTFEGIGERLGMSSNTVKTHYYRGLLVLRRRLAPHLLEDLT